MQPARVRWLETHERRWRTVALAVLLACLGSTPAGADARAPRRLPKGQLVAVAGNFVPGVTRALWYANEAATDLFPVSRVPETPPAEVRVRLPVRGKRVRVVDHLGASRTVASQRGAVSLSVGQGPLYVVEAGRR